MYLRQLKDKLFALTLISIFCESDRCASQGKLDETSEQFQYADTDLSLSPVILDVMIDRDYGRNVSLQVDITKCCRVGVYNDYHNSVLSTLLSCNLYRKRCQTYKGEGKKKQDSRKKGVLGWGVAGGLFDPHFCSIMQWDTNCGSKLQI